MTFQSSGKMRFETTNWSVVLAAGCGSTQEAKEALETLCESYWFPLYAFVRKRGHSQSDARDTVQSFILSLLNRNDFATADPERGKFRTFLLSALTHFLANEHDRMNAKKRGGDRMIQSIDWGNAEARYVTEPSSEETPEKIFHRQWGMSVLQNALQQLRSQYEHDEKLEWYEALSRFLIGNHPKVSHESLAQNLDTTVSAIKSAIHRMRTRFRQVIRNQIAATVSSEEQIEEEIRDLFKALGGSAV